MTGGRVGARLLRTARLSRVGRQLLGLFLVLCLPAIAHGYGERAPVDVEGLRIAPGDQRLMSVDLARVGEHKAWVPQAVVHYADLPLVLLCNGSCPSQQYVPLVAHRITLELSVAVSLWNRLQLAVALPVVVYQGTDPVVQNGLANPALSPPVPAPGGLGDGRIHAKVALLPKTWRGGLGLEGVLSLPTGDGDSFLGTRLPSFTANLLGHLSAHRRITLAASFGARFAAQEQILGLPSGLALVYKAGMGILLLGPGELEMPLYLLVEAFGQAYLRAAAATDFPTEILIGLRSDPKRFSVFAGAGSTLVPGVGTPNVRALVGFSFSSKR